MKITFCKVAPQPEKCHIADLAEGIIGKGVGKPEKYYMRKGNLVTVFVVNATADHFICSSCPIGHFSDTTVVPQPAGSYMKVEP